MQTTREMIQSHPLQSMFDTEKLATVIGELNICAQACTACADACLGEKEVASLAACIRTNLDCADICTATGAVLSRMTKPSKSLMQSIVQACVTACNHCASECERHAEMHAHCRICAESCRRCEKECQDILAAIR
ncbi:MAG: four-helix bundle copper-binding protein [Desulfobacterales bacterium]